jgi:hypothetical protein
MQGSRQTARRAGVLDIGVGHRLRAHDLQYQEHRDTRYDLKLWMRDLKEGAAYLPK